MTTDELEAKARKILEAITDVWVYECSSVNFETMATSPTRVEVEFAALKVLGPYPRGDKTAQAEWCQKRRDLNGPAIAAAKAALHKARIKFTEVDNGKGITNLVLVPKGA